MKKVIRYQESHLYTVFYFSFMEINHNISKGHPFKRSSFIQSYEKKSEENSNEFVMWKNSPGQKLLTTFIFQSRNKVSMMFMLRWCQWRSIQTQWTLIMLGSGVLLSWWDFIITLFKLGDDIQEDKFMHFFSVIIWICWLMLQTKLQADSCKYCVSNNANNKSTCMGPFRLQEKMIQKNRTYFWVCKFHLIMKFWYCKVRLKKNVMLYLSQQFSCLTPWLLSSFSKKNLSPCTKIGKSSAPKFI